MSSSSTNVTNNNAYKSYSPTSPRPASGATNQIPRETERDRAKREARECLQAMQLEGFQLDGFNLLGVVANPRAGMLGVSRHGGNLPTSPPRGDGATTNSGTTPPFSMALTSSSAQPETPAEESDYFSGAVASLESTLGQVTEQIETVNLFLGELSRQYLGDDTGESRFLEYYYQEEEEAFELPPLPPQLANLRLSEIQAYLDQSGDLADSLFNLGLETTSLPAPIARVSVTGKASTSDTPELPEIPPVFSQTEFDLTNPEIFVDLLMQPKTSTDLTTNDSTTKKSNSLYQPTQELVPLKEQDALAGHLDQVELALQEQVRLKAGAFFQETTRFRQLQSSVEELLEQVKTLRQSIQYILRVHRQTKDISNHQRQDYEQLIDLLDVAMELVQTKASIGGLLSANDQFGAAQQIQYGRKLLQGSTLLHVNDSTVANTAEAAQGNEKVNSEGAPRLELRQLTALSTCGQQFQQYENLVIQNLSEELVDVFFNWRPTEMERVKEMVAALSLCGALGKAGELYQRRLQQTVRMTVRTTIAEFVESSGSSGAGVTGMSYKDFFGCLELLIEELQAVLKVSLLVDTFCEENQIFGPPTETSSSRWTQTAMGSAADLAAKSIAELLRLRKEAHSLITLDEMRQLWDACLKFTLSMETYGNNAKAVGLRSTLVGQAKAFLDRTHESNMSSLVAALDSERWTPCEVSPERQAALTRLCTGRAIVATSTRWTQGETNGDVGASQEKKPTAEVEGVQYKVVWSCLLLVEMIMTNLSAAAHFQSLAANAVTKVAEVMRLFNTRATHLVLGAGAIHSAARLKSINAKHLSMVTQCLGMMTSLLPHVRAALMAQLPSKQHTLLNDLDTIKREYTDHGEKVLNKFVTIIGGIVEHGLAPRIAKTDFDARARDLPMGTEELACCVFLEGVSTNTRKMHQVLNAMLPPDHLQDVFSRIFAYVDQKVPTLLIAAASTTNGPNGSPSFALPTSDDGKRRMILEVQSTTTKLNELKGVVPWDFTCMRVLERKLEYKLLPVSSTKEEKENQDLSSTDEAQPIVESTEEKVSATPIPSSNGEKSETDEPRPDSSVDPVTNGTTLPDS